VRSTSGAGVPIGSGCAWAIPSQPLTARKSGMAQNDFVMQLTSYFFATRMREG
jgi:hypothetical protein